MHKIRDRMVHEAIGRCIRKYTCVVICLVCVLGVCHDFLQKAAWSRVCKSISAAIILQ